jgi:hypothetical protein
MRKNGSPPAEFDEDHSYFMVRLPVHPAAMEVAESSMGDEPGVESGIESGVESATDRHMTRIDAKRSHLLDFQMNRHNGCLRLYVKTW